MIPSQGRIQDFPAGYQLQKATLTNYLTKFSWKLYENEENWAAGVQKMYYAEPPLQLYTFFWR